MEENNSADGISFFGRLRMAWRLLFNPGLAGEYEAGRLALQKARAPLPPERMHASGLLLLSALQREGRLVDFLQQEIASFSDEEVGVAARVVHGGCRKALHQFLDLEPANKEREGTAITVPTGFDANRIRLTGNIAGQPPFKGTLKHHGWVATQIKMPEISKSIDPKVIAPAEVELA